MSQAIEVIEKVTTMCDNNESIDIVYLDFIEAFHYVPHERLLTKMKAYGITGNLLNWTRNFLSGRTQKVKVGDAKSSEQQVLSGIPQGSILGPILFTIFINDIPSNIVSCCQIFANDTKVFNSTNKAASLQANIHNMQNWSDTWN